MIMLTKAQVLRTLDEYVAKLKQGVVVMYPTDTVYGMGCDATSAAAVKRIREAKQREEKPFSVIAPNKGWIRENCVVSSAVEVVLEKLPGPFTLLLRLKNPSAVATGVTSSDVLGVRIPKHWWSDVVKAFGRPFVTTSVNISGEPFAISPWKVPFKLKKHIDIVIDEDDLVGPPSTIIDCTGDEVRELRR